MKTKRGKPQKKFMRLAGSISGPPDLSSRRGFERPTTRQTEPSSGEAQSNAGTKKDSVYLLYHLHKENQAEDTQLLLIGAYRSEGDAKAAIKRLKNKPGFSEYPEGFEYHAYELGVENWSDGF